MRSSGAPREAGPTARAGWLAMRLEPDERPDQAPARVEPDPHLASAFTDERGGLLRRHDLHVAIEPRTVGWWGARAPHHPTDLRRPGRPSTRLRRVARPVPTASSSARTSSRAPP